MSMSLIFHLSSIMFRKAFDSIITNVTTCTVCLIFLSIQSKQNHMIKSEAVNRNDVKLRKTTHILYLNVSTFNVNVVNERYRAQIDI